VLAPHGRTDRRASTHKVKNPRGRPTIIATPRPERQVNGAGYGMNHAQRHVPSLSAGGPANSQIPAARNQDTMKGAAHPRVMLTASRPPRLPSDCQRLVPERISLTRTAQPRRVRDLNTAPSTGCPRPPYLSASSTALCSAAVSAAIDPFRRLFNWCGRRQGPGSSAAEHAVA